MVIVGVEVDFVGTEDAEEETGDMAGMTGCHFAALISPLLTFACLFFVSIMPGAVSKICSHKFTTNDNICVVTNLTSLPALLKGSDIPTNIGRTYVGTWDQFWPFALPAAISDSYRYQPELNPDSVNASPSH